MRKHFIGTSAALPHSRASTGFLTWRRAGFGNPVLLIRPYLRLTGTIHIVAA